MKNLGKIFFIFFILQKTIFGTVVASVDSTNVQFGDTITYSIDIQGDDIKKPKILTLCGENVIATSASTSFRYVNGSTQKQYILSYKFIPKKSCTISEKEVSIGTDIEKTKAIEIKVEKTISSKTSDFYLTLESNKENIYVGEPFELTIVLKQKNSAKVVDSEFSPPDIKGFWLKGEPRQTREEGKDYTTTKIIYNLAPQREGTLTVSSAHIKIASRQNTRNYWGGVFPDVKWKTYFSPSLDIVAKPLPEGMELVGDLSIEASVDTLEVNANEAISVNIKVLGSGNLEDVKSFKPYIDGVSVFDEKMVIANNILTQKITFVADQSFVIPAFSLKFFNTATNEMKIISTEPIEIKVKNSKQKEALKIKRAEGVTEVVSAPVVKELNYLWIVLALFSGLGLGILIMYFKPWTLISSKKTFNMKDYKIVLVRLMPYKENKDVKEMVSLLENNVYSKVKKELDTKVLKELLKKYKIL